MSLSKIIEVKISALLEHSGAFYSFSQKQFEESRISGVEYSYLAGGLICPTAKAKSLVTRINQITHEGIRQDIEINGIDKIIERELRNYECFYVGDTADCVDALKIYGISKDEIDRVYSRVLPTIDDF